MAVITSLENTYSCTTAPEDEHAADAVPKCRVLESRAIHLTSSLVTDEGDA